jgi:hypothetical protein
MRRSLGRPAVADGKSGLDVGDNGLLLIGELMQQGLVALPVAAGPLQAMAASFQRLRFRPEAVCRQRNHAANSGC